MNETVSEHSVLRVTLIAVLIDSVTVVLTRTFVLELAREQGNTVDEDAQVKLCKVLLFAAVCSCSGAVAHLPNNAEAVLAIKFVGCTLGTVKYGLELHEFHFDALDGKSLQKHGKDALAAVELLVILGNHRVHFLTRKSMGKLHPRFSLGPQEAFQHLHVAQFLYVKLCTGALVVQITLHQALGNVFLKSRLVQWIIHNLSRVIIVILGCHSCRCSRYLSSCLSCSTP